MRDNAIRNTHVIQSDDICGNMLGHVCLARQLNSVESYECYFKEASQAY